MNAATLANQEDSSDQTQLAVHAKTRDAQLQHGLKRALDANFEVEDELIGIYYIMGLAKEDLGNAEEAVEFYEKVFSLDINFKDVTERLRALR